MLYDSDPLRNNVITKFEKKKINCEKKYKFFKFIKDLKTCNIFLNDVEDYDGMKFSISLFKDDSFLLTLSNILEKKPDLELEVFYTLQDLIELGLKDIYNFYKYMFLFERQKNKMFCVSIDHYDYENGEYEILEDGDFFLRYDKDIDFHIFNIDNIDYDYSSFNEKINLIKRKINILDSLFRPFSKKFNRIEG